MFSKSAVRVTLAISSPRAVVNRYSDLVMSSLTSLLILRRARGHLSSAECVAYSQTKLHTKHTHEKRVR